MDESACMKSFRLAAKFEVVSENFFRPVLVIAEMCDHAIILIEKCDPGMKIRAKQNITLNIDVRRKRQSMHDTDQLSVE